MTTIYNDDFIDNEVYDKDDDDDDKLPARHHATIKWLVSDFYSEWSLSKVTKIIKSLASVSWSADSTRYLVKLLDRLHVFFISCISVTFLLNCKTKRSVKRDIDCFILLKW